MRVSPFATLLCVTALVVHAFATSESPKADGTPRKICVVSHGVKGVSSSTGLATALTQLALESAEAAHPTRLVYVGAALEPSRQHTWRALFAHANVEFDSVASTAAVTRSAAYVQPSSPLLPPPSFRPIMRRTSSTHTTHRHHLLSTARHRPAPPAPT